MINGLADTPSETGTYLIDGFPRAINQAEYFESQVAPVSQVLFYDVPQEVMEARCLKRAETSGRSDDNPETIKKRVQTYFDETMPVVSHYKALGDKVAHIDAMASIDEVFAKTNAALGGSEPKKPAAVVTSPRALQRTAAQLEESKVLADFAAVIYRTSNG